VYDLLWYLTDPDRPEPNMALLRASLRQTGSDLDEHAIVQWRRTVSDRLTDMNWSQVVSDVQPFLERSRDIKMLTRKNLQSLLHR